MVGAPASEIAKLAEVTLTAEDVADEPECVICNDEFAEGETLIELGCKHRYHRACISEWLELNNSCPCCRWQIPLPPSSPATLERRASAPAATMRQQARRPPASRRRRRRRARARPLPP